MARTKKDAESKACGRHPDQPTGYVEFFEWSDRMHKAGWRQRKCAACGFYHLWVKKKPAAKRRASTSGP